MKRYFIEAINLLALAPEVQKHRTLYTALLGRSRADNNTYEDFSGKSASTAASSPVLNNSYW